MDDTLILGLAHHLRGNRSAIAQMREQAGWTQEELAAWSALNRTYLSRLEQGEPTIALRRLLSVITTLGYELTLTPKPSTAENDW